MTISARQIRFFWTAARKCDLSETHIRSALVQIAGVTSVTDLDRDGFEAMIGYFEYLGFTPSSSQGADFGKRPGMASFAQLELIRTLWREYTGGAYAGDEEALNKWLLRSFKRSSLRFVTATDARGMITALKKMKARAA